MKHVIFSKKFGVEFYFIRSGSGYILLTVSWINSFPVPLELQRIGTGDFKQICDGGGFRGSTLSYSGDDEEQFKKICKSWYRSWFRRMS